MDRTVIIKQKAPPDERPWDEIFRFTVVLVLGISMCVLGTLSFVLQFYGIHLLTFYSTVGAGAWGGVLYVITGSVMVSLRMHRLKKLLWIGLVTVSVSGVIAIALTVLFALGAVNDAMLDNTRSWGCEFSHVQHCDLYDDNRSSMVAVQVVLCIIQFIVLCIVSAAFVEFGRPWIACCRTVCGCCIFNGTVVYASQTGNRPLGSQLLSGNSPMILDIPRRGVIINHNMSQPRKPEIETVTNQQSPKRSESQSDRESVNESVAEPPVTIVESETATRQVHEEPTPQTEDAVKTYPVLLIKGVPTVVDPSKNNEPLEISEELKQTIVDSFQHVTSAAGKSGQPAQREIRIQQKVANVMEKLHQQYDGNDEFQLLDPVILNRR